MGKGTNWLSIYCNKHFSYMIKSDGSLWTCGYSELLNKIDSTFQIIYTQIEIFKGHHWVSVGGGYLNSIALSAITTDIRNQDNETNVSANFLIFPNPATDYININLGSINPRLKRGVSRVKGY